MPPNFRETLGLADDAPDPLVHIPSGTINNITFARAIAKIAYSHAVAKYGLNGFRHFGPAGYHPWQIFMRFVFRGK
jgi:hypothetical protein